MPGRAPRSNEAIRALIELMPTAVVVQDAELDRLVAINGRAVEFFGAPREELLERSLADLVTAPGRAGRRAAADLRARIAAAAAGESYIDACACRDAVGVEIPCELRLARMPRTSNFVCAVIVDARENPGVHERLRRAREQLRSLSTQLEESVAVERARISRELHDQLGQLMTAAKINVAMIVRSIEKLPLDHELRAEFLERTSIAIDVVDQALDKTRKMAAELRPEGLDTLGLPGTIESDLDVFSSRTGIKANADLDPGAALLPRKVSVVLLSCMQELLTNVARHAQASRVDVRLAYRNGSVTLEVQDNGVGMAESAERKSLGILGLKERVAALDGSVRFEPARRSAKRPGTAAIIEIPFRALP